MSREVTVYSREQCHLCEEAIETIESVAGAIETRVSIEEVDVDEDPALAEEYGERVPYVFVDDRPAFKYRVDAEELRSLLTECPPQSVNHQVQSHSQQRREPPDTD